MIELDSIFVVLLIEAFGGLILLVLSLLVFSRNKSSSEEAAAHELIDKLEDTEKIKVKKLGVMIAENCDINEQQLSSVLGEIVQGERVLYQNIIQMFLNKDTELLTEIDQCIDNLSEPYCKILKQSSGEVAVPEKQLEMENGMHQLVEENKKLSEQLNMSMSTMDEISAEYTRVFSGTQTELELENSRKKMMRIFRDAQTQVKNDANGLDMEEI